MIWAEGSDGAIGRDGTMPWHVPEDLAHFRAITQGSTVIMGRRTWESLPERFRPLPNRRNLVVTRNMNLRAPGAEKVPSLQDALDATADENGTVWIIGGGQLYRQAMPIAHKLEVTSIDVTVPDADTFAPTIDPSWRLTDASDWQASVTGERFRFSSYERESSADSGTLEG